MHNFRTKMLAKKEKKEVQFNLEPTIIYEPTDMAEDLKAYRKDNYLQKKADAARYERILSPILSLTHRKKIWNILQNIKIENNPFSEQKTQK